MKQLYQCEKCGQFFEEYTEAMAHEYKHYSPDVDQWDMEAQEMLRLSEKATYKEGQEEPNTIHIRMNRYNPDTGKMEYRFGKYRLVSSYAAPLTITDEETAANKE